MWHRPRPARSVAVAERSFIKRTRQRVRAALAIRTTPSVTAARLKWVQVMLAVVVCFYLVQAFVCEYNLARYINSAAFLGWLLIEYVRSFKKDVWLASWLVVAVATLIVSGIALIDGQGSSNALWFLPVIPLTAGQLLGNRAVVVSIGTSFLAVGAVMLSEQLLVIPPEYPDSSQDLVNLRIVVLLICSGVSISAKRTSDAQAAQLDRQAGALNRVRVERDQARRSASVFLASMTGHVRAPMTQLVVRTQSIHARVGAKHAHLAQDAAHCAERVSRLVHDILDLSDLENGRLVLNPTRFRLSSFVAELRAWYEVRGGERLQLRVNLPAKDFEMTLDRNRLRQICTRLMENALKFSEATSLELSFELEVKDRPELVLRVSDDGTGICPERQKQVMERFAFYCDSQASEDKGAGLSLVLIRQLSRAMGGEVCFEATPSGRGTCVKVQLDAGLGLPEAAIAA